MDHGGKQGQSSPAIASPSLVPADGRSRSPLTRSSAEACAGPAGLPGLEAGRSAHRTRAEADRTGPAAAAAGEEERRTGRPAGAAAAEAGERSHPAEREERRRRQPGKQQVSKRDLRMVVGKKASG